MNFKDFKSFANHLKTLPKLEEAALLMEVTRLAELIEDTAKAEIGTYQRDNMGPFAPWAELAYFTKQDRLEKGFTENDPLLRTGEMRASITHEVLHNSPSTFDAVIGSDSEIAEKQELGTSKIPPRAFLGPAMWRNREHILKSLQGVHFSIMSGKKYPMSGVIRTNV
ncbi:MAG: hypothetical protein KGI54_13640 [Pseudomonadota bacterium]|nr:hypothetical protein [Pseudomonadota bacterium]